MPQSRTTLKAGRGGANLRSCLRRRNALSEWGGELWILATIPSNAIESTGKSAVTSLRERIGNDSRERWGPSKGTGAGTGRVAVNGGWNHGFEFQSESTAPPKPLKSVRTVYDDTV